MIYVRVNKAASTSVSNYVKGKCDILQLTRLSKRVDRFGGWLDREKIKNQECFTVVRNPYDRAISCWMHCKRIGNEQSFEQWLETDFSEMMPNERIHSLRQADYLFDVDGSIGWIDHIIKLEDSEFIVKLWNVTGIKSDFPHNAKGKYKKDDFYTPYAKELVKSKYSLDFRMLGYKK